MKNKGFTLIELIIVVAIICIISAIAVNNYWGFKTGHSVRLKANGDKGIIMSVLTNTELGTVQYSVMVNNKYTVIVNASDIEKADPDLER